MRTGTTVSNESGKRPSNPQVVVRIVGESAEKHEKETDGLRSWIVCAICTILLCGGSVGFRSSGVLLVSMAAEFGVLKGQAVWPTTALNLCMNFVLVLAAPPAQKFPLKPIVFLGATMTGLGFALGSFVPSLGLMTIFFGAVHGSGMALLLVGCNTLLTQYFDRFRGLAFGIAHSSSPFASMVFPPLITLLKNHYGFRNAMLAVGILLLSAAPLALLVNDAPWISKGTTATEKKGAAFAWSVFREPMFYILMFTNVIFQWIFDTFLATVIDYGIQRGLSTDEVLLALACYSVSDISGRILFPAMADWGWFGRDTLLISSYFLSCVFLVLSCACRTLWQFIATFSILGGFFGLSSSYFSSMIARYLGLDRMPFSFGLMGGIGGFTFLATPAAVGFFKDQLNDYRLMYLMCTFLLVLASLPWVVVVYRRKIGRSLEVSE